MQQLIRTRRRLGDLPDGSERSASPPKATPPPAAPPPPEPADDEMLRCKWYPEQQVLVRHEPGGTFRFRAVGFNPHTGRVSFWQCWNDDLLEFVEVEKTQHPHVVALLDRALAHQLKLVADQRAAEAAKEAAKPLTRFEIAEVVAQVAHGHGASVIKLVFADGGVADPMGFNPAHHTRKPLAILWFGGNSFGHRTLRNADEFEADQVTSRLIQKASAHRRGSTRAEWARKVLDGTIFD